jgi:transposase
VVEVAHSPSGGRFQSSLGLALADGKSYSAVEAELNTSRPTIARWRARFEAGRIEGLEGRYRGSRPRKASPAVQARILKKTQQKPADGSTHWSCRKMAAAVGVSPATVHRIWAKAGLKPHRLDRYMASNDPAFEEKAADIIALYMDPPQHAAVFCVDEKTAIQALDRLDPVLPLSPGRAEKHGFEYYRHGTLSLYAALDVKTGKVHGKTARRQNPGGAGVPGTAPAGPVSLHPNVFVVAEPGRDMVREDRARRNRPRRLHLRRRSFPQADEIHSCLRQNRQALFVEVYRRPPKDSNEMRETVH